MLLNLSSPRHYLLYYPKKKEEEEEEQKKKEEQEEDDWEDEGILHNNVKTLTPLKARTYQW